MSKEEEQSSRDTQFAGFAREVTKEMLGLKYQDLYYHDTLTLDHYEQTIARRAYDLAVHCISSIESIKNDYAKDLVGDLVSDLAELPKEGREA